MLAGWFRASGAAMFGLPRPSLGQSQLIRGRLAQNLVISLSWWGHDARLCGICATNNPPTAHAALSIVSGMSLEKVESWRPGRW